MAACLVCRKKTRLPFMCRACGSSYDKLRAEDVTLMATIEWAANRAADAAKKRAAESAKERR